MSDKKDTWNNTCVKCGTVKVTHGDEIMGQCRTCGCWRFLCHLVEDVAKDDKPLPSNPVASTITPPPLLLPLKETEKQQPVAKQGVSGVSPGDNGHRGRGRPEFIIPDKDLADFVGRGLGCKLIAQELTAQGTPIHFTTIAKELRRYKRSITQGTNQNEKGDIANASDK